MLNCINPRVYVFIYFVILYALIIDYNLTGFEKTRIMLLKKRRKYIKPDIIIEDFLDEVRLLAASPSSAGGSGGPVGEHPGYNEDMSKSGLYNPYTVDFSDDDFDGYDDDF